MICRSPPVLEPYLNCPPPIHELQEQLDRKNSRTKQDALQAKRFRSRLFLRLQTWVDTRFQELLELASRAGQYNTTVRYDQYDNVIVEEKRDFLNNVVWVRIRTRKGDVETIEDEEVLAALDITEETVSGPGPDGGGQGGRGAAGGEGREGDITTSVMLPG